MIQKVKSVCSSTGPGQFRAAAWLWAFLNLCTVTALTAQDGLISLQTWFSPERKDHFTTPFWVGGPADMHSPDYRFVRQEGYVFDPSRPQPPSTVSLYGWYSPGRGDNHITSVWPGEPGDERSPDYRFSGVHGYAFERPLAGTVPLNSWYNHEREDNRQTSHPDWWAGAASPDLVNIYRFSRTEGYVLPIPNAPPYDPAFFGYQNMKMNGRLARGTRPLLVIMVRFSDDNFHSPHTASYYQNLIFGNLVNGNPNINGYFYRNSNFKFRWRNAGIIQINMPDDPATPNNDESTIAYWSSAAGGRNVFQHGRLALGAADAQVNFASYDSDNDGVVESDELCVLMFHARQPGPNCGQSRTHQTFSADGKNISLYPSVVDEGAGFGTICHELFHQLGTDHVYGNPSKNFGFTAMAGTCAGEDVHQYFHADAWHKMRLGWLEPRVFPVNAPGATAFLNTPQYIEESGDNNRPILLYDPARQRNGIKEYFLLEHRRQTTGVTDSYDATFPGAGLVVWWVRTAPNSDEFHHFSKVLPGGDATFQTRIPAGSDDRLVDANGDGVLDEIRPGPDFILQTKPFISGNDLEADDPAMMYLGAPNSTWGTGRPWRATDGILPLRYYDGTDSRIRLRIGPASNGGNTLSLEWRREPALEPRLDRVTVATSFPCHQILLEGMFPVREADHVQLIANSGEVYECPVESWDIREILVRIPPATPAGDYHVRVVNGTAVGNRLPYRLDQTINPSSFSFNANYSVDESAGQATLTIYRNSSLCGSVTLSLRIAGGTAQSGQDYPLLVNPFNVSFGEEQLTRTVTVPIEDDLLHEEDETIVIELVSASDGAVIGARNTSTVTIHDDDPLPSLMIGDVRVLEGDTQSVFVDVPITLSAASLHPVVVRLSTQARTATAGMDFEEASVEVTIAPGLTRVLHRIEILPDQQDELDETFALVLAELRQALVGDSEGVITIQDNDATPTLAIGDLVVVESDNEVQEIAFPVELSGASALPIQFNAVLVDGTAVAGEDFREVVFRFTIDPSLEVANIRIPVSITGRPGYEPDEVFYCRLHDPRNARLADDEGSCTIRAFRIVSVWEEGSDIRLAFPSGTTGERYHVWRKDNLTSSGWLAVTPEVGLEGTGDLLTVRDGDALGRADRQYYRIEK